MPESPLLEMNYLELVRGEYEVLMVGVDGYLQHGKMTNILCGWCPGAGAPPPHSPRRGRPACSCRSCSRPRSTAARYPSGLRGGGSYLHFILSTLSTIYIIHYLHCRYIVYYLHSTYTIYCLHYPISTLSNINTAVHCGLTLVALAGPLLAGGPGAAARDLVTPVQVPVTLPSLQLVAHAAALLGLGDDR